MPRFHGDVDLLAELVGWSGRANVHLDWQMVEHEIGMILPSDYKDLVARFPEGEFNDYIGFNVPRLEGKEIRFLVNFDLVLEDYRRWRSEDPIIVPYPLYPDVHGLIPWGTSVSGETFFWLPNSDDPEEWGIVAADPENHWEEFSGSTTRFLVAVVTGTLDSTVIARDVSGPPRFVPYEDGVEPSDSDPWAPAKQIEWLMSDLAPPENEVSQLEQMVEGHFVASSRRVDWWARETLLGIPLPSDYKNCIDLFGLGSFRDVRILLPGTHNASYDMVGACDRMRRERDQRLGPDDDASILPIFPESRGLIPWGSRDDGMWFCWPSVDQSADLRYVLMFFPGLIRGQTHRDKSMTGFLRLYLSNLYGGELSRDGGSVVPLFTPADSIDW